MKSDWEQECEARQRQSEIHDRHQVWPGMKCIYAHQMLVFYAPRRRRLNFYRFRSNRFGASMQRVHQIVGKEQICHVFVWHMNVKQILEHDWYQNCFAFFSALFSPFFFCFCCARNFIWREIFQAQNCNEINRPQNLNLMMWTEVNLWRSPRYGRFASNIFRSIDRSIYVSLWNMFSHQFI